MTNENHKVYQFKVILKGIKPVVWRRIQVPESYNFWDLHVAIQDAMGWHDGHLHSFNVLNPQTGEKEEIGIVDEDGEEECLPGWEIPISSYITLQNEKVSYAYDFGDNWEHSLLLEKIIYRDSEKKYPLCIAGEMACPPENCGGIGGYEKLLNIIKDPNHEEYDNMLEWLEDRFDPERFHPEAVQFDDPQMRWKQAFDDSHQF